MELTMGIPRTECNKDAQGPAFDEQTRPLCGETLPLASASAFDVERARARDRSLALASGWVI